MEALKILLDQLNLQKTEELVFTGEPQRTSRMPRLFGGHVMAQALAAAIRTVPDKDVHSLHAYFLRGGSNSKSIRYEVEILFDGRSFSTRQVHASQDGECIFTLTCSFHNAEDGAFDHQIRGPAVPGPEGLKTEQERALEYVEKYPEPMRRFFTYERPFEIRPVTHDNPFLPRCREPENLTWVRTTGKVGDDTGLHATLLAWASDMHLLGTSTLPHRFDTTGATLQAASLDHSIWFHRPFRADEWLLYHKEGPSASGARGWNQGHFYNQAGDLVASVAQEGLIRSGPRKKGASGPRKP